MQRYSICLVGVLDVPGSTNISMAVSCMKYGAEVIPINYRTVIKNYGMAFFARYLIHIVEKYRPILVIFSKCNGIDPELVTQCSKVTKTWLFNMDPKPTIERCPEVIEHAKRADFSSCTARDMVGWFESFGVKNCYHIIQGVDQGVFKPVEPVDEFRADISLIGTRTHDRDNMRDALINAGFDVKYYGNGYGQEVINNTFAQVCASSKFMLSVNTFSNIHTGYFSNRLVRYLGCGSCVFHYDNTGTLGEFFTDKEDLFLFSSIDELIGMIRLIDDETAMKVAFNGRDKTLNNYSWDHIMGIILRMVQDSYRGDNGNSDIQDADIQG